ncbi:hypothetical protein GPECTOR_33g623 [Gonium pectorale]|uniref:histidine kinase n=1 Tax=Gonium pectorale TaxID=33097 RepID=A0A150GD09_GONPE|nr:hypothetical protein GPECTOR_33g623 [Gonium pectorale]|eukprot:KXZ47741.1 hypothetical protein GPECTOR_33g623 [Gonium pectorale]
MDPHVCLDPVPPLVYQMSSTAFFTALVLNLTSLMFEDNATKRQLALLSVAIKGAACHTDMLLVTGRATVVFDAFGAICIPQRYVQWCVTTPTMVYILSKISDFTPSQTATAIAMDVTMVITGLLANFTPWPLNLLMFGASMLAFGGVLYMMGRMVYGAVKEHTSAASRRSLLFIYMCTLLIWCLFPLAWLLHVASPESAAGEYLNVFANFMAKVLFSSSIMYGNYMTISQRRLLAQAEAENANRVRLVADLRDAVTRKDQFMSLMSHELRTPLNGIIQLSDAMVRGAGGEMNPKGQHFVRTIKNSSNHLLNIINDILDVAALKEGKLTIKHELCCLDKAVDHVVDIVAPLAKKDVAIERSVDPRTPLIIADFSRVIQILYNLTGNALKFTHRGRVAVRVTPAADGGAVTLVVSDTGIGIPKERIPSIWGAFEQVDMSVTRKYGGTGLGLNIVKQLVTAHDGNITVSTTVTVTSEEGVGTTFTVTLPVLQPSARRSLEVQVHDSLAKCGYQVPRAREKPRSRAVSGLEDTFTQLTRGITRKASGLLSPKQEPPGQSDSVADRADRADKERDERDVLYRRRTQELERENLMGDLQRRTEHKRSMDEAHLASRSLEMTGLERRAERDTTSLDRRGGGGGGGGGAAEPPAQLPAAGPSDSSRLSASPTGLSGLLSARSSMVGGGGGSARQLAGGGGNSFWRSDAWEQQQQLNNNNNNNLRRSSIESQRGGGGGGQPSGLVRKSSNVSLSSRTGGPMGQPYGMPMRGFGRPSNAGAAANGGGTSLLKSALESDLYRLPYRDSWDGASSFGADSESEGARLSRRHHHVAAATKLAAAGGSVAGGGGGGGSFSMGTAAAATASPPGLTLDKLAYSDMYGTIQILSVDDEEVNQIVLEEILTSTGYGFVRCMDGLEALEWLCASETLPDLILLDCMMPNMSGHEFCATLRRVIPGNVLPVIMVSAKSDEENIVEGLRSGSNDFVRKPYQREELLARIETQLRLKKDSWWLAELVNNVDGRETESMKLLKAMLPESIIARMQQGQKFVADSHSHVVILFSDIVGFTSLSSKLPTAEVFLMLSNMFTAFDKLTDRFSVYKVETIGDAYMVAAGHDEDDDKAAKGPPLSRVLGFARAMLDVVRNITAPNGERLRVRIVSSGGSEGGEGKGERG